MSDIHYRVGPTSRRAIRSYAKAFRKLLHLENDAYIDIIWLMENVLPEVLKKYNFSMEVLPKEEMGKNHGLTDTRTGKIYIREDVYDGACRNNGRDRLTLAHEVGHFLLHAGITPGLARTAPGEKVPCYCDPEWQATAFAGEFLMDHDVIRNMTIAEVVQRCCVSYQAASIQKSK